MVAAIIIAVIVALIVILLFVRAAVTVTYSDDLSVVLKILFLKFSLYPKKEKKPITSLSKKQLLRLEKKKQKKADKKSKKKAKKAGENNGHAVGKQKKKKKHSIVETLTLLKDIFSSVAPKLAKYLKITLAKIHITVATDDAAKTAITYGVVSQSVAYLIEALDIHANLCGERDIAVDVDYLSEKSRADLDIKLSLRVWQVIYILLPALIKAGQEKNK